MWPFRKKTPPEVEELRKWLRYLEDKTAFEPVATLPYSAERGRTSHLGESGLQEAGGYQGFSSGYGFDTDYLRQALDELRRAGGWTPYAIGTAWQTGWLREWARYGWHYYIATPIVKQGVQARSLYTFGQGVTVTGSAKDINDESLNERISEAANEFWQSGSIRKTLATTKNLRDLDDQVQIEGNAFLMIWQDGDKWYVRALPSSFCEDIILSKKSSMALGYVVQYTENKRIIYPALDADESELAMEATDGVGVDDSGARILHVKGAGPPWAKWGIPSVLPAIHPALQYEKFVEDWAEIQDIYKRVAMTLSSAGGGSGIANFTQRARQLYQRFGGRAEQEARQTEPEQTVGHVLLSGMTPTGDSATKVQAVRTAGATDPPSQARELKLLACAAFGLPETMFGDSQTGNHATAESLERTVELRFTSNQVDWSDVLETLVKYAVCMDTGLDEELVNIAVSFPPLLQHNLTVKIESLVKALDNGAITERAFAREVLAALDILDSEELLEKLFPDGADEREREEGLEDQIAAYANQVRFNPTSQGNGPTPQQRQMAMNGNGRMPQDNA